MALGSTIRTALSAGTGVTPSSSSHKNSTSADGSLPGSGAYSQRIVEKKPRTTNPIEDVMFKEKGA
jgi:hypothetical protein